MSFCDADLPEEGKDHNLALHISMNCKDDALSNVLVDTGSSLNLLPKSTLAKLSYQGPPMGQSGVVVKAFDGSRKTVIGEVELPIKIGPSDFHITFQVMDIHPSYSCLLGRPWIHEAGAVTSTLHQKLKFVKNKKLVVVGGEKALLVSHLYSFSYIDVEDEVGMPFQALSIAEPSKKGPSSFASCSTSNLHLLLSEELGQTGQEISQSSKQVQFSLKQGPGVGPTCSHDLGIHLKCFGQGLDVQKSSVNAQFARNPKKSNLVNCVAWLTCLEPFWKTWPVTWPGNCLKSSLRGNVCDCLPLSLHRVKDLLSEEAIGRTQGICNLSPAILCVICFAHTTVLMHCRYKPKILYKCTARDKSCEVSSSPTFHQLHLSPSMARLRANTTQFQWCGLLPVQVMIRIGLLPVQAGDELISPGALFLFPPFVFNPSVCVVVCLEADVSLSSGIRVPVWVCFGSDADVSPVSGIQAPRLLLPVFVCVRVSRATNALILLRPRRYVCIGCDILASMCRFPSPNYFDSDVYA
ncbi:hypothetical protein KIW84_071674 [Lathyrus oleraceus]|uniref:Uncharacterized protein n=1 Tax=Pisum sativum TaxID=3888 RepID=A0A9D4VKV2_PEA|nr:hypothetical protein KIW84_071674 [Pisum sativum]